MKGVWGKSSHTHHREKATARSTYFFRYILCCAPFIELPVLTVLSLCLLVCLLVPLLHGGKNDPAEFPFMLWTKSFWLHCLLLHCWPPPLSQSVAPPSVALDVSLQFQHFNPFLAALSPQHILLISRMITATSSSTATQRKASHQWLTWECPITVKVGKSLEVWLSSRWQQSLTADACWEQNVYT